MLVRPGGISAGMVNHAENGVRPDEIPGIDRLAAVERVADQFVGIDGFDAAVGSRVGGGSAIELRLVDLDSFLILRSRSVGMAHAAAAVQNAVAGIGGRRRQNAIVCDVVVGTYEFRSSSGDDSHQARERIRRLGGGGPRVVDAGFGERCEVGTRLGSYAVLQIEGMHAVDADEEYVAVSSVVDVIVGVCRKTCEDCQDCQTRAERDRFDAHASPPWALVLIIPPTVPRSYDCKVTVDFRYAFPRILRTMVFCITKPTAPGPGTAV